MPKITIPIGKKELIIETGKVAKQASGSVMATFEGSAVLATVCYSENEIDGLDYVPLQVEYNEKYYAAGKIPGGFLKREGRPKDKEILVSRLIDRPMRPLFYKEFKRDIQIVPTVLSSDQINPPDIVAMIAASAAVVVSDIPFNGPVGSVRMCYLNEEFIVNPTFQQISESRLEIIVAGTSDGITMVEGGANEVSEELMIEAIDKAYEYIKIICDAQKELASLAGKEKAVLKSEKNDFPHYKEVWDSAYDQFMAACFLSSKIERNKAKSIVKNTTIRSFENKYPDEQSTIKAEVSKVMEDIEYKILREAIVNENKRSDGRKTDQIRAIECEVGVLSRTHGSALFTRGETQALAVTTLGTVSDEQMFDDIDGDKHYNNFMLHYNFPPFSVGEKGNLSTGRREIGHGHLAMRAISAVIPEKEKFPYTIRVVSEILESNGSSSMATVCGSTLALLDAGVPIKKPVAGIAMGLISENDKTEILSDILGEEDHFGDMDFKVAGTEDGITAFQMDIKISNVTTELMKRALEQARIGRLHILGIMNATLSKERSEISDLAPQILTMTVEADKIGAVIGTGGKTIKGISEKSESTVNIDDKGKIIIFGKNKEKAEEAKQLILSVIEEPEPGKIYKGTVKKIMEFGAFVEILPGKEGLCHISKLSFDHVNAVTDVVSEDQELLVKLMEIDRMGRLNLSHIDAVDPEAASKRRMAAPQGEGGESRDRDHREKRDFRGGNSGRRNSPGGGFSRRNN
ncbi:MAG: polyribonucleotide nucleotidyltransferase [Spirochaetia bacterium]|jgi:polyribonucleotide nucleotidyltransferase|nr:polyribonucleotide nucleotidyltransferase [Spirochaetia bacterium]